MQGTTQLPRKHKPRPPRRLEPDFEPRGNTTYTLTGTLLRIHERGYGFLGTGRGEPDYFIMRQQVPPKAWVKGARFGFDPEPPRKGTAAPRAINVVVLSIPAQQPEGGDHE